MEQLPTELLERIVRCDCLSHTDLLSFSETCSRFRTIVAAPDVWRLKFLRRFSRLFSKIQPLVQARHSQVNWRTELRKRLQVGGDVLAEVEAMSPRLFQDSELSFSDFSWFDDLLSQHNPDRSFVHLYIVDSLLELVSSEPPQERLTTKYYAAKALSHVQHRLLRARLGDLWLGTETETGPHSYEEAMIVVAQWCQPNLDLTTAEVSCRIDSLAERVLARLLEQCPEHGVFRTLAEQQPDSARVQLTKLPQLPREMVTSLWPPQECGQVLEAANNVLFELEGLKGNREDYYNPHNSFINHVLDSGLGIPISLCLLYQCVLRRLGVLLAPVNFPGHFLLRWEQHPHLEASVRHTYIDAFEAGKQVSSTEVRERVQHLVMEEDNYQVATPGDCARRMLRNLISIGAAMSASNSNYFLLRAVLELMMVVNITESTQYAFMLSRIYLQLNINQDEVLSLLADHRDNPGLADQVDYLLHQCQLQLDEKERTKVPAPPKKRGVAASFPHGEIRFWVGEVCRHKKYHYTCVIYGWDPVCKASKSWITQMGVDTLEDKDKQPFYNVLVADGSRRYAAQENLVAVEAPCPVKHPDIGRYFSSLDPQLGYLMNQQLSAEYPHEAQIQHRAETGGAEQPSPQS